MTHHSQLSEAYGLLQAGQLERAEQILSPLARPAAQDPDYWRLAAMVARKRGDASGALERINTSLRLRPGHAETLNTLGLIHDQLGDAGAARTAFENAIAMAPAQAPARINLARLVLRTGEPEAVAEILAPVSNNPSAVLIQAQALQKAGRFEEALRGFDGLCRQDPSNVKAYYGRALCLIELGAADDAMTLLDALVKAGAEEAEYARFTALARLRRFEEAEASIRKVLSASPTSSNALHGAAQLYWMQGDETQAEPLFEAALKAAPASAAIFDQYIETLVQMGHFDAARAVAARAEQRFGSVGWVATRQLGIEVEAADLAGVGAVLHRLGHLPMDDPALLANRARALLMLDRPDEAEILIEAGVGAHPDDRFWVAMRHTVARALGDEAVCRDLADYDRVTRTTALKPPAIYAGIDDFNRQLAETLRRMHSFSVAPLDQSLRAGSQTSTDLRHSQIPVLRDFFAMVEVAFNAYAAALPRQSGHPLFGAVPSRFQLNGAWSVRLGPQGRHVDHVHPEGWVSSVYYVAVPEAVAGAPDREGWLKFGEPPFPVPGLAAERFVEPKPGELTLFPSYVWHGTLPIKQGERLTIAFDISPG